MRKLFCLGRRRGGHRRRGWRFGRRGNFGRQAKGQYPLQGRAVFPPGAEEQLFPLSLVQRQLAFEVGVVRHAAILTVKMNAVLIPNKSTPSAASSAPIICQCGCSITPEAPRVAIESTE